MTRRPTNAAKRRARHQPPPLPRIPACSPERVGKLNAYTCQAGHVTFTIDRDAGVTPAGMPCPYEQARGFPAVTIVCELHARSAWYRLPDGDWQPTHEWYRPDDDERRTLDAYQADHVNRSGLLLRPIEAGRPA